MGGERYCATSRVRDLSSSSNKILSQRGSKDRLRVNQNFSPFYYIRQSWKNLAGITRYTLFFGITVEPFRSCFVA